MYTRALFIAIGLHRLTLSDALDGAATSEIARSGRGDAQG
jgi:hypothetical protein